MWQHFASLFLPLGLLAGGFLCLVGGVAVWRRQESRRPRSSPLVRNLLRPPGHALRRRIDALSVEVDVCFVMCLVLPSLFCAAHLAHTAWWGTAESTLRQVVSVGAVGIGEIYTVVRLLRLVRQRRELTLAWEGELATAEELNQLMLDGHRVFHDVVFPYGNIDHVVVGLGGVFCINTKTRGKPTTRDDRAVVTVDYEHQRLLFPDGTFSLPFEQLRTEAKWLAETLTAAVGAAVKVESLVALPGWFVETAGDRRGGVRVFNPRNPRAYFRRLAERAVLDRGRIEQIAHQLDQLCRNITPTGRRDRSWDAAPAESLL